MKSLIIVALLAGAAAVQAAAIEHKLPAPMPEFKTPEKLAQWRQAKAAAAQEEEAVQAQPAFFYTGKPYIAETGTYAFKYRDYDPSINRWTTADPSGFPDGVNNHLYVNGKVVSEIDADGKNSEPITLSFTVVGVGDVKWKGEFLWSFDPFSGKMIDHKVVETDGLTGYDKYASFSSSDASNIETSGNYVRDVIKLYAYLKSSVVVPGQQNEMTKIEDMKSFVKEGSWRIAKE